jgi:hypothetical protein
MFPLAVPGAGDPFTPWGPAGPDEVVAELDLLLTRRQAEALEATAQRGGLTVGVLLRRLIRDFLARPEGGRPRPGGEAS